MQLNDAILVNTGVWSHLTEEHGVHWQFVVFDRLLKAVLETTVGAENGRRQWVAVGDESVIGRKDYRGVAEVVVGTWNERKLERQLDCLARANESAIDESVIGRISFSTRRSRQ